jgi:hypothetical protein
MWIFSKGNSMTHPFLHMTYNHLNRNYASTLGVNFCTDILIHMNIVKDVKYILPPYALFFYKGDTFVLEKKTTSEWVNERARLNDSLYYTDIKVQRTTTRYFLNDVDITTISRPTSFDNLFSHFGNKISFDCYYL